MECFVMVTYFTYHWDKLPNSETSYPKSLISENLRKKLDDPDLMKTRFYENITTYFVKINNGEIEHIYEGHISDVREKNGKIWFKVHLEREIRKDEYNSHFFLVDILRSGLNSGWYPIGWHYQEYSILPSFFKVLKETKDWDKFEDLTYYLLKLIGINNIHKYDKQRGLPDGIFKIGNLVVIYDATLLEPENWDEKQEQISNYINKLREDKIKILPNMFWEIKGFSKRIWIITRYKIEERELKIQDDIKVKAISIDDLFEIYEERLREIKDEETLKKKLENL